MVSSPLYELALKVGGYLGLFIVSILGNLIPFVPVPYLAVVFVYSAVLSYNPLLTGIVSGLGGAVGKLVVYWTGRGASKLIVTVVGGGERLEAFKKLLGDYGALAAFLFAATPSPDDIVMLVLGMIRYDPLKFLVATALGKIVISLVVAYGGWAISEALSPLGVTVSIVVSLALLVVISAVIFLVDWVKVLEIVSVEGWRGVVETLRRGQWKSLLVRGRSTFSPQQRLEEQDMSEVKRKDNEDN